jgi:hypothetical protein
MKNRLSIFFLLALIGCSLLLLNRNIFISVTSLFRTEIQSKITNLDLEEINLILSDDLIAHFKDLYKDYRLEDNHSLNYKKFLIYYNKHNSWKNAQLIYKKKTYQIKIKSHGKSPSNHKERDFISLSVNLLNNEKIKGVERFNLIVYWRIKEFDYEYYSYIAKKIDLLVQKDELVLININNKKNYKLYYFEFRADKNYLASLNYANLIALKRGVNKSLLYFEGDIYPLQLLLAKELKSKKYSYLSQNEKDTIYYIFNSLNIDLYNKNYNIIHKYFDLDYISNFLAMKTLSGAVDGFEMCNLICPLSLSNQKFYPMIHRACLFSKIDSLNNIEKNDIHYRLINMLNLNDSVRIKKYQALYNLISNTDMDSLSLVLDSISSYHESLYYSSYIKRKLNLHRIPPIIENMKQIKNFIYESNPIINMNNSDNNLIIKLSPRSMSPLVLKELYLIKLHNIDSLKININIYSDSNKIMCYDNQVIKINNNKADLSNIFNKTLFYDNLDSNLNIVNTKYTIELNIQNSNKNYYNISEDNLRFSLTNHITKKIIYKTYNY